MSRIRYEAVRLSDAYQRGLPGARFCVSDRYWGIWRVGRGGAATERVGSLRVPSEEEIKWIVAELNRAHELGRLEALEDISAIQAAGRVP